MERVAKAARELDNSKNVQQAIILIQAQELNQHAHVAESAEMDAYTEQQLSTNTEREAEELRTTFFRRRSMKSLGWSIVMSWKGRGRWIC